MVLKLLLGWFDNDGDFGTLVVFVDCCNDDGECDSKVLVMR